MTPFNLESAMQGASVCDEYGEPVKIIGYSESAKSDQQLIVEFSDGEVYLYSKDGTATHACGDLRMVPPRRSYFVNLYVAKAFKQGLVSLAFDTLQEADINANSIATEHFGERIGGKAHEIIVEGN